MSRPVLVPFSDTRLDVNPFEVVLWHSPKEGAVGSELLKMKPHRLPLNIGEHAKHGYVYAQYEQCVAYKNFIYGADFQ